MIAKSTTFHHDVFGLITETIKDKVENVVSELEYKDKEGNVIGYWAYGFYDPRLPYQG